MELNNELIAQALGNLTVLELIQLTRELEKKWDVKAEPQMVAYSSLQPVVEQTAVVAQTEFSVVLLSHGADKKMSVLKMVRELTGLGLKEAKDFVEGLPKTVKDGVSKDEAEIMKNSLVSAGGTVIIK